MALCGSPAKHKHQLNFHAGCATQISVIVSGHNTGSKPMNLSAIVGSINSPEKFDVFIQNFTVGVSDSGARVK